MNKKGFSLVEIMVAFVLTAIISTFLFRIIIGIKEMTHLNDIKTQILVEKGNFENLIYDDINKKGGIASIGSFDGNYIIKYNYEMDNEYTLSIDNNQITYNNTKIVFPSTTKIEMNDFSLTSNSDGIQYINIAVSDSLVDDYDFDINIVSQSNDSTL